MPSTPNWKIRRLAGRTLRVLARRAGESPALGAYNETLSAKATAYMAAYDAYAKHVAVWQSEMAEGRNAVTDLGRTVQA